jgi:hypothetical protein
MARSSARASPVSPSFPKQFWARHPANRQQALQRKRETENPIKPFIAWPQEITETEIFDRYDSVIRQGIALMR